MKFLAQPKDRDDLCSVTQRALVCKYYEQCSFNCAEQRFFNNLNKINLRYANAIHWLSQLCNVARKCERYARERHANAKSFHACVFLLSISESLKKTSKTTNNTKIWATYGTTVKC